MLIDEKTAHIVRKAFKLILQGYSCVNIANIFNEKGYITRSDRKEELGLISYKHNLKTGTEVLLHTLGPCSYQAGVSRGQTVS